jgi:PPOX class probable F420-dependent enzyme
MEHAPDGQPPTFPGKYVALTTYRRDGTPVSTPVWFVQEKDRLFLETDGGSFKVKRLLNNPSVLVATCGASGRPKGEQVRGHAEVLGPEALAGTRDLIARKYRIDKVLVLPIYHFVQRLKGTRQRAPKDPVIVAVTITP